MAAWNLASTDPSDEPSDPPPPYFEIDPFRSSSQQDDFQHVQPHSNAPVYDGPQNPHAPTRPAPGRPVSVQPPSTVSLPSRPAPIVPLPSRPTPNVPIPNRPAASIQPTPSPQNRPAQQPSLRDNRSLQDELVNGNLQLNNTKLDDDGPVPNVDQALAHLRLLHAIHHLRTSVMATDGLFGYHDIDITAAWSHNPLSADQEKRMATLLQVLAEKRWAIYVVGAVHRFAAWIKTIQQKIGTGPVMLNDMAPGSTFPKETQGEKVRILASQDQLPPLDVLMVWHSFMLNPRCYIEDCVQHGMMSFWRYGMPWSAINSSIDTESNGYDPGDVAKQSFEEATDFKWSNIENSPEIVIECPKRNCKNGITVNFTNIERSEIVNWADSSMRHISSSDIWPPQGEVPGYCEPEFSAICDKCNTIVNHQILRVSKFLNDVGSETPAMSLGQRRPLPGTILDCDGSVTAMADSDDPRYYPNLVADRLVKKGLFPTNLPLGCSMESIRDIFETVMKALDLNTNTGKRKGPTKHGEHRVYIRRMMSRYWGNSSPFSLDLVGAVIRQGKFIEKMQNIDWLHSPSSPATMARFIQKYERFFNILTQYPDRLIVPTLDVDLIWHTHQLSPRSYYAYSMRKTGKRFVDHDDKVAETRLSEAFGETSRLYQMLYKQPYSQCVCWYCESIRAIHDSGIANMVFRNAIHTAQKQLCDPKTASDFLWEPGKEPHLSAHNAIKPKSRLKSKSGNLSVYDAELYEMRAKLAVGWADAQKRAKKAGRKPPPPPFFLQGDAQRSDREARDASGAPSYYMDVPMVVPYYAVPCEPGLYPSDPSCANLCPGEAGNCVAGTCGGGIASGACGNAVTAVCSGGVAACGGSGDGGGGGDGGDGGGCGGGCGG